MRVPAFAFGLLACLISQVAATALTYKLGAHEKACFYTVTQKDDEKVAFYFAVSFNTKFYYHLEYSVSNGLADQTLSLLGAIRWFFRC